MKKTLTAVGLVLACILVPGGALADKSGTRPQVISVPRGPGSVAGLGESFQVNLNSGSMTETVPLHLPPGTNGHVPGLALTYDSGAGNGSVGLGWNLPVSYIQVQTEQGLPRYDSTDRYLLDGQEFVRVNTEFWRPRNEGSFVRMRRHGVGWEVNLPTGHTRWYGRAQESRVEDAGRVFAWYLEEEADPAGNRVVYAYERDRGQVYLRQVRYNARSGAADNRVELEYEPRPDALADYRSTFKVVMARRLARIGVYALGQQVRRYELAYHTDRPFSLLSSVTMYGDDGRTALPPLTFDYMRLNATPRLYTMKQAPAQLPGGAPDAELTDMDGDGFPDLLVAAMGNHGWHRNQGGRSFAAREQVPRSPSVSLGTVGVDLADVNGDGTADLVARTGSTTQAFRYFPNLGQGRWESSIVMENTPSFRVEDETTRFVDLDHDKRVDVLRLNTSSATWWRNEGGGAWSRAWSLAMPPGNTTLTFSDPRVKLADMNGDRLMDLVFVRSGSVLYWPGMGRGLFDAPVQVPGAPEVGTGLEQRLHLADLSGDGLADLVYVDTGHVDWWPLSPTGAFEQKRTLNNTPYANATLTQVRVGDMNGNGTLDVVWFTPTAVPDERVAYLDVQQGIRPNLLAIVDNGMGLRRTFGYTTSADEYQAALEAGRPWTTRLPFPVQVVAESMLSDSRGGSYITRYRYADGYYSGDTREFRGFGRVEQREEGDNEDPTAVHIHRYDLGLSREALKGRLWLRELQTAAGKRLRLEQWTLVPRTYALGMDGVDCVGVETTQHDTWLYEGQDDPSRVLETWEYDEYGNPTKHLRYGHYQPGWALSEGDESFTFRTYINDERRWVLGKVQEERVEDPSGTRLAATRNYYDGEPFVGLPAGQVRWGLLTRQEQWVEGDRWIQAQRLQRDVFGNVTAMLTPRGGRREIEWDRTHTFPVVERVFAGDGTVLQWTAGYQPGRGLVNMITDPQGATTLFAYDTLERLTAIVKPGDSPERPTYRYEYSLGSPVSRLTTYARPVSGEDREEVSHGYFDGLGRKLGEVTQAEGGKWVVSGLRQYSRRGSVLREWDAAFIDKPELPARPPDVHFVLHAYDEQGRNKYTRFPDGTLAQIRHYALRREVWDSEDLHPESHHRGTPTLQQEDGLGRVSAVVERINGQRQITTWKYDGLGRRLSVTNAKGQTTTYRYNGLGQLLEVVHPDAGRRQLQYDEDGNVTSWQDAVGNRVEREHDLLGRLLVETHIRADGQQEGQIRYHYDRPSPRVPGEDPNWAVGRLTWVEDLAGEEHFAYDIRGRMTDDLRIVAGREYLTRQAFDNLDHVVALTYPDGTTLEYQYNERGLLSSVPGIVDSLRYNAQGLAVERKYANGVVATAHYDYHERVGALKAVDRQGKVLQDLSYAYDQAGTLVQIKDTLHKDSARSASRSFIYDNLYRLLEVRGPAVSLSHTYDAVGNLLSKSDVGVYAYGAQQPNAVQSVAGNRLTYDANGSVLSAFGRTFTWNVQGHLAQVGTEEGTVDYRYDFEGQRVLKRVAAQGRESTTVYVDRYSEERDGQLLKYVFSGSVRLARLGGVPPRTVAALSTLREGLQRGMALLALGALALGAALATRGGQVLRLARGALAVGLAAVLATTSCGPGAPVYPDALYYVGDHLQSTSLVTDASGKVVAEAAYDVWGQQVVGTTEPYTYTGHEWDAEAGLYYAGSRYYDPKLGRFLSVDPATLDNPGLGVEDPQVLNPYAYARNTPTSLADRDGRLPHVLVGALAGAVVGTGIYLVKGAITGESYTWRGALAAGASGAVAGALGAATGGLSLAGSAVAAGASGTVGGVVERSISTGSAAETFSPKALVTDAVMGVATFGVVKGGGHVLSKVAGPVRERMGAALGKFTSRGQGGCSGACGVAGRGCFVAGTLVLLASGQALSIEQVRVGDKVLAPASAAQPEQVGSFEVLETSRRQVEWVVDLTLEDATGHRELLTATPDHPVLRYTTTGTEWVQAAQVRASDTLASPLGRVYVRSLQTRRGPFEVYNLTVASAHAYLVGSARLVVHNGACGGQGGNAGTSSTGPGKYIPKEELPTQRVQGVDIPLPDPLAQGPHTTLGGRLGSDGVRYRQSATFPEATWPQANGKDVPLGRVDWHNHGRGDHTNPHIHIFNYSWTEHKWNIGPQTPWTP